jgi:tetratricopeptide (TPR) repeat protein
LGDRETAARAQLLAIAGLIHTRQGNYDQALEQCENAIRIAEHLGDTTSLAFACNSRAIVFRRHGDYGTAIEYFLKAAELYERAENIHGQAMSYNGIANTYSDIGSWTAANDYARRAREIFVQTGDELHRVFVDNNLGEIARNQGRLDDALTFYQDALHSMEQMGGAPYVMGALHINLGATFVRRGEIDSARLHLRISQESLTRVQSRDLLPALHLYLAEAALQVSELDEAEAEGQLALDLARELAMRGEEGSILRVLGEIALARRDLAQAEAYLLESLAVLDEVGHEYEAARSRLSLAEVYLAQRRAEAGLAEIERCAPVFQRLDAALDLAATRELREKLTRYV